MTLACCSRWFILAGVFLWSLSGCSKAIKDASIINPGQNINLEAHKPALSIDFAGVAAYTIRYKNSIVLTDPFVSNPPGKDVVFHTIHTDTAAVLHYYDTTRLNQVKMLVVGHAHYDHLLDVPYLLNYLPESTKVLTSATGVHILAAEEHPQPTIVMNDLMGRYDRMGQWVYSADSSVRVMAFESDHPAHFMGITLFKGPYTKDLTQIPDKGNEWKRGTPLSFLIDFMDADTIAWRIFAQSSSAKSDLGLFPTELLQEKPVDVMMTSVAVDKNVAYPIKVMDRTKAPVVFLSHWENFFKPKTEPYESVPKTNVPKVYKKIKASAAPKQVVILPKPGSHYIVQ